MASLSYVNGPTTRAMDVLQDATFRVEEPCSRTRKQSTGLAPALSNEPTFRYCERANGGIVRKRERLH
jgi:hypothetical protein